MKTLTILKTRPKKTKIFASILMKIEGTDFSHVAVSYKDQLLDIRYVAEARGGGIRIISNTQFKLDNYIVSASEYDCEGDRINQVHKYIYNQLAKDYGYKHLIGLGIMRLAHLFINLFKLDKQAENPFKDGEYSQVCTELGVNVIRLVRDIVLPLNVENYGLKEFNRLDLKYGKKVDQEKIDRINGVLK
jgi:hypothetical protein